MIVGISRSLLEQIVALAAADRHEVCGLLLGGTDRIEAIIPAANVAADPARHFELDPAALIAAHRAARLGGPAIIGHYHSHPSGVAAPSVTDAACATADGSLWLIVGGRETTLWRAGPGTAVNVHFTQIRLDSR
ncbi:MULTISPECIES: Mov34/MPN/PAD-1 family protein [Sphingobium]|jgi:proteasome lid subunit RPN8/RPN11|uniref:Mov34/MPN/PAD-1 family protein n=1 Tax=Sphingobium TaxID=165695 RepID=UPI000E76765D|nr:MULTISPECIES: M67 family metallopeptidase [Sphingobium]KAA9018520.1 M67 family metallopeptidase [Sphingobium limneticum]MBU0933829.1 M67 family metallopeptidase [Alphaproteobacteria bacterium]